VPAWGLAGVVVAVSGDGPAPPFYRGFGPVENRGTPMEVPVPRSGCCRAVPDETPGVDLNEFGESLCKGEVFICHVACNICQGQALGPDVIAAPMDRTEFCPVRRR